MTGWISKLFKFLTNHKALTISWITALQLLVFGYGCQPKCRSIFHPEIRITGSELNAEITMLEAQINDRQLDLQQQQQIRDALFAAATTAARSGAINPVGLATSLAAILGIGAGIEGQVQKRKIKKVLTQNHIEIPAKNS